MIKYFEVTDNIGSGNFTDTFCQDTFKFQKSGGRGAGGGGGGGEYAYHRFADHLWLISYC